MTKEEAIEEVNKVFEPAFANYIITALTEGATVSDIQHRWGRAYEAGVKDGLEQEPMVEIDLYSAIKQKYIEREVLDKIRAEIEQLRLHKAQFLTNDNKVCIDSQEVLNILDKYKSESEG